MLIMTGRTISLLLLAAVLHPSPVARAANDGLVLRHKNPDGWFNLLVPTNMTNLERFADVDGGLYRTDRLKINYDYWTFPNTPNFLRGQNSHTPILACDSTTTNNRTWRANINGRRAVLQRCSIAKDGYRYLEYVTFPRVKVFDGESFHYGMFNISVAYKNDRDAMAAACIVRSVRFTK
jgi:hypothetical protein